MALTNGALINALIQHQADSKVFATTPHATYEFDIVNVEGDPYGDPVLRLVEREVEGTHANWHSQMGLT